jgi:hypothetical protein
MRARRILLLLSPAILLAACATAGTTPSQERVVAVDGEGRELRQSTADEYSYAKFDAPADRVWLALRQSYADLGIAPTVADRAAGRYGNESFVATERQLKRPLADYFRCSSYTPGSMGDQGRVIAHVVTTIASDPAGGTRAMTRVNAMIRRGDGTGTNAVICGSTGALEQSVRETIQKHLAGTG